ncbi:MAG TPA: phosphoribosylglycinamide formyltransferase [Bacillales bacterium]|nr:phosphoribosylglycinamide formyltransferase [Bacillales bacterium]
MKKIAVFASGSGSNFQSIVDEIEAGRLEAKISLLVCDNPGAYVIDRAKKAGIQCFVFNPKEYRLKADYEREIAFELKSYGVDFVVLAGYMRLIGSTLLEDYEGRMVNIHPSLLPDFPGKDAIGQALAAKVDESGVTIHYVDNGMDTGPIIAQKKVKLDQNETRESLEKKIHIVEHWLYPSILQLLFTQGGN